jgi:hypothetical protein
MPQTLRNCFRSFSRVVQAMKSLLPTAKPPLPLQENLDRAQPAESAWDHHDYADDHETRCLYSHAEPRDGLWRCCNCLHENEVTHFRGPHPFKIVECPCAHTLCTTCCTTEILTPVRSMATEVFERRSRTVFNGEVLYCRVCPCGLTHRAVRNGNSLDCQDEPCDCGEPVDAGNYYFIGSVHEYRRDPLRRANEVMEEHIEKSSARQMARLSPVKHRGSFTTDGSCSSTCGTSFNAIAHVAHHSAAACPSPASARDVPSAGDTSGANLPSVEYCRLSTAGASQCHSPANLPQHLMLMHIDVVVNRRDALRTSKYVCFLLLNALLTIESVHSYGCCVRLIIDHICFHLPLSLTNVTDLIC